MFKRTKNVNAVSIEPTPDRTTLVVKPSGFLKPRKAFDDYLNACRTVGCTYHASSKTQRLSTDYILDIIGAFAEMGWRIDASAELSDLMRDLANKRESDIGSTDYLVEEKGLYPFQAEGVRFLRSRDNAVLIDDMGLGKTVQSLMALPDRTDTQPRVVVVCPAVVKHNWAKEVKRWRPDLTPIVCKGRKSVRQPEAGEVVIMNYELIPKDGTLDDDIIVIIDEIHYLKSAKAQRTQKFRKFSANVAKRWGLTGTPVLNRPAELWGILRSLNLHKEAYGSWRNFMYQFGGYQGQWSTEWGIPQEGCEKGLQRVALRRRKTEVLHDLPTKAFQTHEVDVINPEVRKIADKVVSEVKRLGMNRVFDIKDISLCRRLLAEAKTYETEKLVKEYEDQGEPVVVFSAHRAPVDKLASRDGWASITGDTPHDVRQIIVEDFQNGKYLGLACTITAAGIGITLTHASHAIFVDREWTPALNWQAEDRICRIGQDRGCMYTFMVADHVLDQMVDQALESKRALIDVTVEKVNAYDPQIGKLRQYADLIEEAMAPDLTDEVEEEFDTPVPDPKPYHRGPETPQEFWAKSGILILATHDSDRASEVNGVGFNKLDGDFGHSLADQLEKRGLLTDKQWGAAIRMCRKYHRQIGECP